MKLKPGKYYKTRGGDKAVVKYVCEDPPQEAREDERTCFGFIWKDGGECFSDWSWMRSGEWIPWERNPEDLVSEWTEPEKITAKFFFDRNEKFCGFEIYCQDVSFCESFGNCIRDAPIKKTVVKTVSFND